MNIQTESKPGVKTSELWLVVLSNVLVNVGAIDVGAKYRGLLAVLSVLGYTLSRGLAKQGIPAEFVPGAVNEPDGPVPADDHTGLNG